MKFEEIIQFRRIIDLRKRLDVYEQENINSMLSIFDKAIREVKESMLKTRSLSTKLQQKRLLSALRKSYKTLGKTLAAEIREGVLDVGGKAFEGMIDILSWDGKDIDFNIPLDRAETLLNAVDAVPIGGAILSQWVDNVFENTAQIQSSVLASNLKGEGYRKMFNSLTKVYPDYTKAELITLARTYNQSVVVAAQEKLFKENEDIVKKVRWSAAMELGFSASGRGTCPRCAALDGNEYTHKQQKPSMPLHARCRCMWEPVTLSWSELFKEKRIQDKNGNPIEVEELKDIYRPWTNRKEANINLGRKAGNIDSVEWSGKDYGDFITAKGGQALINAVGPNRARLIESGKIDFSDLVDKKTGELFTLKELGYPIIPGGKKIPPKPTPTAPTVPPKPFTRTMPEITELKKQWRKSDAGKEIRIAMNKLVNENAKDWEEIVNTSMTEERSLMLQARITERNKKIMDLDARKIIEQREQLKESIYPSSGATVDWYTGKVWKDKFNKFSNPETWKTNFKLLAGMLHPDVIAKLPRVKVILESNTRAHYKNGRNTIRMGDDDAGTVIHEFGHHIEYNMPGYYEKALALRKKRTVGESLSYINGTKEVGYRDEWFNHYVGRKYDFESTELISMGLEQMHRNPYEFLKSDPEFFEFILKVMWGLL